MYFLQNRSKHIPKFLYDNFSRACFKITSYFLHDIIKLLKFLKSFTKLLSKYFKSSWELLLRFILNVRSTFLKNFFKFVQNFLKTLLNELSLSFQKLFLIRFIVRLLFYRYVKLHHVNLAYCHLPVAFTKCTILLSG